jgi:hypothetical protein
MHNREIPMKSLSKWLKVVAGTAAVGAATVGAGHYAPTQPATTCVQTVQVSNQRL